MSSGFAPLYRRIEPYIRPVLERLDTFGVPYRELRCKISELAQPQFILIAWLALVVSAAPSVAVASAAGAFVIQPLVIHRFKIIGDFLAPEEGRPQTRLEALARTFFNHRAPEITEIEAKLETDQNNQALLTRRADLQREDTKLSAGEQAFFIGASFVVTRLLPGPLLYPFMIILGLLIGDHLFRFALRQESVEEGTEPVHGFERLIQACSKSSEEKSEPTELDPESTSVGGMPAHVWSLLSEQANRLLHPIKESCEANHIPLIPLVHKIAALADAKIKCMACTAVLILASPATLPYITVLVASIWLILDSLGNPLIPPFATRQTHLERVVQFFDNEEFVQEREKEQNTRNITLLEAKETSNTNAITAYNSEIDNISGSMTKDRIELVHRRTLQNEEIKAALAAYRARNAFLAKQNPGTPTSTPWQVAAFLTAYVTAKLTYYWMFYGLVAAGSGILLGNHLYHWAKREEI